MDQFVLTRHAQQRAIDMALDPEFIRELLIHPHVKRVSHSPKYGRTWHHCRDEVAAIVSIDGSRVITFLPATEQRWRAEDEHPMNDRRFDPKRW